MAASRMMVLLVLGLSILVSVAKAEIVKTAVFCEERVCFKWWPQMPTLVGWHHDEKASISFNANVFVNDKSPPNEMILYANAKYKPAVPNIKSVSAFIEHDKQDFKNRAYAEVRPLLTSDKISMRSLTFFPKSGVHENWEQVTYGEGKDKGGNEYYLLFVLSAKTKKLFDDKHDDYVRFVAQYREKMQPSLKP